MIARRTSLLTLTLAGVAAGGAGCSPALYVPQRAARYAYPREMHTTNTVDIQVFRDDTAIELVNATPTTYRDVDVWVNQRFVLHVDAIPAGATMALSLWDFFDERGHRLNAGGFFRTQRADPVRLVEMQPGRDGPMVGLITIVNDDEL